MQTGEYYKDENEFIKSLYKELNSNNYYPIKRAFGKTLETCEMSSLIAYTKVSKNNHIYNTLERNAEFLVAGLCYTIEKPTYEHTEKQRIPFEVLMNRMYNSNTTDSIKGNLEKLINLDQDNMEYFCDIFRSTAKRVIPFLGKNQTIDYSKLLYDIKHWNNRKVRMRWATALIDNKSKEEN